MTTAPDMLMQFGGAPVGVNRLASIFQAGNIWFVDYDGGNAGFNGKTPTSAKTLPSAAVTAASMGGIIYIKPRLSNTCEDVYYADNITVPATKPQLQFIGAGAGTIPAYRSSAQLRISDAAAHLFTIQSSGVSIENLHLNGTGSGAAYCSINCVRNATYPGAIGLQVRNCRFINGVATGGSDGTLVAGTIGIGSCQYSIIEDNLFEGCINSITHWATYGSPQSSVIRRNIFSGLVSVRDADILIGMLDINSRGHIISDNIFADGLPALSTGSWKRFIFDAYAASSVATGIVTRNSFATSTADSIGASGSQCVLAAGWFAAGNYYEGTSATGLSGFITKA